jgi:hypothetical protein
VHLVDFIIHSNGICHAVLQTACEQDQDGTEFIHRQCGRAWCKCDVGPTNAEKLLWFCKWLVELYGCGQKWPSGNIRYVGQDRRLSLKQLQVTLNL